MYSATEHYSPHSPTSPVGQSPRGYGSQDAASRATVMIVDDDPALLTLGRAILSTLDLNIVVARSGEEALISIQSPRLPELVLLDLTMPGGMSGLETFDTLHEKHPQLPVVACSGFFGDGAEEMCQHIGFAGMLPKPYTAESLVSVVRRVLMCHA
ncbi:MAG: response regulator [Verrucomicrobiaceae bacterium]|nr:response regulator [Verrucomicrobiaceae bacterium]